MRRAALQRGFLSLAGPAMYLVIAMAVALAASWAASGLAIWYLDGKVEKATVEATKAKEQRAAEEQSRKGFQAAGAACSAGVEALERRAGEAELALAKKAGESQGLTRSVQAHIQAMLNRPRPAGLDECQAMKKELDDEVDHRARRL